MNGSANLVDTDVDPVYITNVNVGAINHSSTFFGSAAAGFNYSNNTWVTPAEIESGSTYTIDITNNYFSGLLTQGVWIDYNQDGDFSDPNEEIGIDLTNTGSSSFTFTAPAGLTDGQEVVMRVRSAATDVTGSITACNNLPGTAGANNETEDYRVILRDPTACAPPTILAEANGTDGMATICTGQPLSLDGGPSGGVNCGGTFEYAWSDGTNYWDGTGFASATPVFDANYDAIAPPSAAGNYSLEVECSADATCAASSSVTVNSLGTPASITAAIGNPANGTQHELDVSWGAVAGATNYELEYSLDGSTWLALTTTASTSYSHDLGDQPNIPVYYRVRALSTDGTGCAWQPWAHRATRLAMCPPRPALTNATQTTLDLDLAD